MHLSKYSVLKCFSGQIWSQKLKFLKLTEIWYRHTLLYPCFEFNVNSFNFFFHSNFWGQIWFQNLKFSKLTEIWYQGASLYVHHDFNIYFFKIFVIHCFLGKFGSNLVPNSVIVNSFFCITTFEMLRASSRSSLHNT